MTRLSRQQPTRTTREYSVLQVVCANRARAFDASPRRNNPIRPCSNNVIPNHTWSLSGFQTSILTIDAGEFNRDFVFRPTACELLAQGKERSDAALGYGHKKNQANGLRDQHAPIARRSFGASRVQHKEPGSFHSGRLTSPIVRLSRRNSSGLGFGLVVYRWSPGSCPRLVSSQSGSSDQQDRRGVEEAILEMGEVGDSSGVLLAGGLRCVFGEFLEDRRCEALHPESGRASPKQDVSGRVSTAVGEARSGLGRAVCVGLNLSGRWPDVLFICNPGRRRFAPCPGLTSHRPLA